MALRCVHLAHGLPDFVEEAIPFRNALAMHDWRTGRISLNPQQFNYPSLGIYLQLLVQQLSIWLGHAFHVYSTPADYALSYDTDPTTMIVLARLVTVGADLAALTAVHMMLWPYIGPLVIVADVLMAAQPSLIRTGQGIFVDPIAAALGMAAIACLVKGAKTRGTAPIYIGSVFIGLAVATKYTWIVLVCPQLAVCTVTKLRWRVMALSLAISLAVFASASPFVLLNTVSAERDIMFEIAHASPGVVLNLGQTLMLLRRVADNLGYVGLGAVIGSMLTVRYSVVARVCWLYLAMGALVLAGSHIFAERYLELVLPICVVLIAIVCDWLFAWRRVVGIVASGAILFPVGFKGVEAASHPVGVTQIEARRWMERTLGRRALILQDAYGVSVLSPYERAKIIDSDVFASASSHQQQRFLGRSVLNVVSMPIVTEGKCVIRMRNGGTRVYEPMVVNDMIYDAGVLHACEYVVVSNTIRARIKSIAGPRAYAWYTALDGSATPIAQFADTVMGVDPTITVYRVPSGDPPDPLWWPHAMPDSVRDAVLDACGSRPDSGNVGECFRYAYADYGVEFVHALMTGSISTTRFAWAEREARGSLEIIPDDPIAFRTFAVAVLGEYGPTQAILDVHKLFASLVLRSPESGRVLAPELGEFEAFARRGLGPTPSGPGALPARPAKPHRRVVGQ